MFKLLQILVYLSKVKKQKPQMSKKTQTVKPQQTRQKRIQTQFRSLHLGNSNKKSFSYYLSLLCVQKPINANKKEGNGKTWGGKGSNCSLSFYGNIKIIHKDLRSSIKRWWWKHVITLDLMVVMITKVQEKKKFTVLYLYKSPPKEVLKRTASVISILHALGNE